MKRRLLTVALALLLAVIGTAGVLMYVSRADARALAGQQAVTVLVADKPIPGGTSAAAAMAAGLLTSHSLPAASVTADAVESITPELGELVTSAVLPAGQLLLRRMLVPVDESPDELTIPEGMVAVSLQFCVPQGVAGFVRPGSIVAVTDTAVPGEGIDVDDSAACAGPHRQQTGDGAFTAVVLPRVSVLAVGPAPAWVPPTSAGSGATTVSETGEGADEEADAEADAEAAPALIPQVGLLLTVAVSMADAQRLIVLTHTGLPYLVLLPEPAP